MKKTTQIIYITIANLLITMIAFGQPSPWVGGPTTNQSATLSGNVSIFGNPAQDGDYIAAFNQAGQLTGVAPIFYDGMSTAFFALTIYGNEGAVNTLMSPNENFTIQVWDMDTDTYYEFGDPASQVGPWNSQNGGPLMNLTIDGMPAINGFSTFPVDGDNILPIELSEFRVQKRSCDSYTIEWKTEVEINNEYFSIQRSIDNISDFKTIDRMDGAGNSNSLKTYSYEDKLNFEGKHTIYYRLKQTDYDGRSSYSNVLSSKFDCGNQIQLKAFPNPFSNEININVDRDGKHQFIVLDAQGRTIANADISDTENFNLSTDDWPIGLYIIRYSLNGEVVESQKILKQY
jgi:hypothetical protein